MTPGWARVYHKNTPAPEYLYLVVLSLWSPMPAMPASFDSRAMTSDPVQCKKVITGCFGLLIGEAAVEQTRKGRQGCEKRRNRKQDVVEKGHRETTENGGEGMGRSLILGITH